MVYTEKEKAEIARVREVFAEHIRQSPYYELLWSDKVGYVWLSISVKYPQVYDGWRIKSAADLCEKLLNDVAEDVLEVTDAEDTLDKADPLELAEVKRRWKVYIDQLPEYAYLCQKLLKGRR